MISTLTISDPTRLPTHWWSKVPALKDRTGWDFGPGLTILWGPNGCGKSTVLTLIAHLTHCEQGGRSTITQASISALWDAKFMAPKDRDKSLDYKLGATVVTDGQAVRYINPTKAVGHAGGSFDDDFFEQGLRNTMSRGSGGQTTIMRLVDIIRNRDPVVKDNVGDRINDLWKEAKEATTVCLRPTLDKGPLTVLLDEPDLHLDIPSQANLWKQLVDVVAGRGGQVRGEQVIVASHSVFAVNVPGATYVDLVPGYLDECRKAVAGMKPTQKRGGKAK